MNIELAPKSTEVELSWTDAQLYCRILDVDGKSDWRLPTIEELSYLNKNRANFDIEKHWHWSSTMNGDDYAWTHHIGSKYQRCSGTDKLAHVIAVRDNNT